MTFHLVPVEHQDHPAGPQGHELAGGRIYLYRAGSYELELEGVGGEPLTIPSGEWVWIAEASGFVSTFTTTLRVPPDARAERALTVPVVPACRFERSDDHRWQKLDRVDVASFTESSLYPIVPSRQSPFWVPAGHYLAYAVQDGELSGIGGITRCDAGDEVTLPVPEPPAAERQSLMVTAQLPEGMEPAAWEDAVAELVEPGPLAAAPPASPDGAFHQGRSAAFFFLDGPAERSLELALRHPALRSAGEVVDPLGGSVREIGLGSLRPRRSVEVPVEYLPARAHASADLALLACGRERADTSPELLAARCEEPEGVTAKPLAAGVGTYRFDGLDDGQYMVTARIDDEELPGLGQRVLPYLDPETDEPPAPLDLVRLVEMEVHGRLLLDDEPVAGVVELSPWEGAAGIPHRRIETDEDLEYHLYYFARYPTEGETVHFPEELRDEPPEDLPGLYCCFQLQACGSGGACRTFNIHSQLTGEGVFDIELPGTERVEIAVVDAGSGEPVGGARVMVRPSPMFHFHFGEVIWQQALGAEPDGLDVGDDGRVVWLPPEPGRHRLFVRAAGYETGQASVEVAEGAATGVTVELEPDRSTKGTRLVFEDDVPVTGARLVAFGEEGERRAVCDAELSGEGFVELPGGCSRAFTYLLVHARAALQTVSSEALAGSAVVEARLRPSFPPRLRLVDADGEPVANAFVQLRLGELTITPNDLFAAAGAGLPFQPTTNAVGELVLQGVDVDTVRRVEVSPWEPFEENWVALGPTGQTGVVDVVVVPAR